MKRVNNLYDDICDVEKIIAMTDKVCSRTKNKNKVHNFTLYKFEHICNIYRKLKTKNISLNNYNIFMINDPKCRIIMAQELEDKIINHLIADNVLVKIFESKYTGGMCATRIGKGTLYGVRLLKKYINEIKFKYDNFYVLKLDISKYFYNVDHEILKRILNDKIKDKDVIRLLNEIIDSTNKAYVNEIIKRLKNNRIKYLSTLNVNNKDKLIKEVEKIPLYKYGKGLALGNQTSQAFGLIYLYELNHFIKEELHIKYLINYMDDFVILHHDKEYLKYCLDEIIKKLKNDYKLDVNPKKTKINSIKNGVDFLGYHFILKNNHLVLKLRAQTKTKIRKKVSKFNKIDSDHIESRNKIIRSLISYNGVLKWGNCKTFHYKYLYNCFNK